MIDHVPNGLHPGYFLAFKIHVDSFFCDILVLFPKTSELITYNYAVLSESKIQEINIMGLFFYLIICV